MAHTGYLRRSLAKMTAWDFRLPDLLAQLIRWPWTVFNEEMRNHFLRKDLTAFDKVLQWDMKTWFPEQALMKLDRLSMAHGLEARCPFADHRLAEILFQMPLGVLVALSANKNVLRRKYQQGRPYLSKKKRAFYLPFHQRYRAVDRLQEETLTPEVIKAGGVFKYDAIAKLLKGKEHSPLLVEKQVTSIVALMQWMKNTVEIKKRRTLWDKTRLDVTVLLPCFNETRSASGGCTGHPCGIRQYKIFL